MLIILITRVYKVYLAGYHGIVFSQEEFLTLSLTSFKAGEIIEFYPRVRHHCAGENENRRFCDCLKVSGFSFRVVIY